jgi:hypothetical protein
MTSRIRDTYIRWNSPSSIPNLELKGLIWRHALEASTDSVRHSESLNHRALLSSRVILSSKFKRDLQDAVAVSACYKTKVLTDLVLLSQILPSIFATGLGLTEDRML